MMEAGTVVKQFTFSNQANELYHLVVAIADHLAAETHPDDALSFKVKVVLTELLTNAIKHSGCDETILEVTVQKDAMTIKKFDFGDGFTALVDNTKQRWPLPGRHFTNKVIGFYNDGSCSLMAKAANNLKLKFFIEEGTANIDKDDVTSLSEHFGLMIMTRACDSFEYEFDIDRCSNVFTALFKR